MLELCTGMKTFRKAWKN